MPSRLKVPLVYDLNAMAMHGIDPAEVEAKVPAKKMTYSQILAKVLLQAKLQYELRVDEADKPFLWITTVKHARTLNCAVLPRSSRPSFPTPADSTASRGSGRLVCEPSSNSVQPLKLAFLSRSNSSRQG